MGRTSNTYEEHAAAYAAMVEQREQAGPANDPVLGPLLAVLGDVAGQAVLDACCGEGYLARILAGRGAAVTGIDIASGLIARAQERDPVGTSTYRVADLSAPLPEYAAHFDRVACNLALNDVPDYQGCIATLYAVLKPGGRAVFSLNNPYSYIVRKHITDYFAP